MEEVNNCKMLTLFFDHLTNDHKECVAVVNVKLSRRFVFMLNLLLSKCSTG